MSELENGIAWMIAGGRRSDGEPETRARPRTKVRRGTATRALAKALEPLLAGVRVRERSARRLGREPVGVGPR